MPNANCRLADEVAYRLASSPKSPPTAAPLRAASLPCRAVYPSRPLAGIVRLQLQRHALFVAHQLLLHFQKELVRLNELARACANLNR